MGGLCKLIVRGQTTVTDTISERNRKDLPVYDIELPTLRQIRDSIPAHLFEPNMVWAFYYCVRIAIFALGLGYINYWVQANVQNQWVRWAELLCYWVAQGLVLWGGWVLQHDMGHGSFSSSPVLNYIAG